MKKIKLKGLLFQNLYEKILVRQKLKTKQENHLINSIDIIKQKNVKIVILSHIQKEKEKKKRYSHHPFVFKCLIPISILLNI